ncbi:unnamed protein product [Schistosoma margrebowiei]|uniref:HTH myb-type domain-containing protein n=2 Tax=Schistosoma margrebowiei TaxID=48269 RepID=A0AA85A8T3_9TREM|nr:unnamed protein product [Schistosoma margrebowiei]
MLDELPHRVNWKDSNTTIGSGSTSLTTGFHETHKERFEDCVGSWTNLEDCRLLDHVSRLGENRWNLIGKKLGKSAFQCSERYLKHLRPQMLGSSKTYTTLIQHRAIPQTILNSDQNSTWTKDEDSTLLQLYLTYGSNWELIANRLTTSGSSHKKRTAVDVRQRYEKVVLQYWPNYDQENRPLSSLLFRNSLLSWSNSPKNNSTHNNTSSNDQSITSKNNARPTYLIPLSSLKSNYDSTTNGNWKIRLTQPIHHHDSGFSESGLSNSVQSGGSNSQQSLRYSVVTTSISSHNSLLSTSTPVDLIKNGPLLSSPDKSQLSLPSSSSLLIKSNSPKLLESSINDDLINSPTSSFSFNFYNNHNNNNNNCSSKTTSPLKSIHQTTNGSLSVLITDDNNSNNTNNNHFVIQTPTKALSEADQLSFHLTSPPAVLGSAGRYPVTSLNHKTTDLDKTPIGSRIPRCSQIRGDGAPLRRPLCTRLFDNIPNNTSLPSTSLSSSFTVSSTNRNNLSEKTFSTLSSSATSYNSCDEAKCIAILTAKATVWNRALLPTTSTSTTATSSLSTSQKSHLSYFTANNNINNSNRLFNENEFNMNPYHSLNFSISKDTIMNYHNNLYPYKSYSQTVNNDINFNPPLKPLKFPARKQPHLTLRRIVQIANEDDWQEVAYGNSYASQTLIRLAKSFTNNYQQQSINELNDLSSHSSLSSPLLPIIKRTISEESINHYSIDHQDCFLELEQPMDNY